MASDVVTSAVDAMLTATATATAPARPASASASKKRAAVGRSSLLDSRSVVLSVVAVALLLRVLVAQNTYSGFATGPRFGDYEAQRHWMEITVNLPVSEWYRNSTLNDLDYWGLDYPPLTAYVSWAFGKLAQRLCPELVQLTVSRGVESYDTKLFMRLSVLVCDALVYFPALYYFFVKCRLSDDDGETPSAGSAPPSTLRVRAFALAVLNPAFILIDHGHFQYNNVSLGLAVLAVALIFDGHELLGSVAFTLSVCFKQMSLYYAPAFFFFLLGKCIQQPSLGQRFAKFAALAIVALATLAVMFAPFIATGTASAVLSRVFPFKRGLYEDKVANFWCASSLAIKWPRLFELPTLVKMSLAATLLGFSPAAVAVLRRPSRSRFVVALCCTAFSFFLFSFQVHEKTILLPLQPLLLLLAFDLGPRLNELLRLTIGALSVVACFSMYPLLRKDGLTVPYCVLTALYAALSLPRTDAPAMGNDTPKARSSWTERLASLSVVGVCVTHAAMAGVPLLPLEHSRYPDIAVFLVVLYCAAHFVVAWLALSVSLYCGDLKGPEKGGLKSE